MYPESLLWWIGGTVIIFGLLGILVLLAWWVDSKYQRHVEKNHGAPGDDDDQGRSQLWIVFEVFSAIFVVTGILVAIYSDTLFLRAIAGVSLVVIVAAATYAVMSTDRTDD